MQRIKGIMQLAVAAALVALVVWTNIVPDEGRRIEDATYVEDAQVLPENEGARVVVAGTISVDGGAADESLGIAFDSPVARRAVDQLRYRDGWEWVGVSEGSTGANLTNATFVGKVTLGQFELDEGLVRALPLGERDWEESDLDAETAARLEQSWYSVYEGTQLYLSQVPTFAMNWDWPLYQNLEGAYRVRYRVWNGSGAEVTVVGIQCGNPLCFDSELNAASAFEGILDANEIVATNNRAVLLGEIVGAGIPALILLVLGVRNVREL